MTSKSTEMIDFTFEKDDFKVEDNFKSSVFSTENQCHNIFKEFSDYSTSLGANDFNMNEFLGLNEDSLIPAQEEISSKPHSDGSPEYEVKYEDFEPFDIPDLSFDPVMETFDTSGLGEAASDSGISTTDHLDFLLSPSSGTVSPDPILDVCIDSTDTISDVSSTSDLGSMGSVGDSPNRRSETSFSSTSIQFDLSPSQIDDDVEMSSLPSPVNMLPERNNIHKTIITSPHYIKKIPTSLADSNSNSPVIQNLKFDVNPNTKIITPMRISNSGSSLTYKTISNNGNPNNKISTSTTTLNTATSVSKPTIITQAGRSPSIVPKVRLDTRKLDTKASTVKCNIPPTIYVTQAGKGASLLKNRTLLRAAGNGKPFFVPVNINSINQMKGAKTFKIICQNNGTNRIGNSNIGTLVSTVRPLTAVSNGTVSGTNKISTTPTTLFTATSKGSDGRPLIKVTPTACVTPNSHTVVDTETPHISVTPSIIKEEPSDDESLPQSNQELILTEEEKRLMRKEGLVLPSRYPLTKQEERDLKRIRRKIRNKISAQDSRKRKKEYVDGLEERVRACENNSAQLQKKIRTLEKQNDQLKDQLKRYQTLVGNNLNHGKHHNHASTALMMLILSTALIVVPTLRQQDGKGENELSRDGKIPSSVGHSRTLLGVKNPLLNMNMKNLDGFSSSDQEEVDGVDYTNALTDHDYAPSAKKARLESTMNSDYFSPPHIEKTFSIENEPPDSGGLHGIASMFAAMLDRLGRNWTDPGGSFDSALNLTPHRSTPERSSVVVNLNHGKLLRDDLELE